MTKPPRPATAEQMIAVCAQEDMAKATIGAAAIQLFRSEKPVSWPAIIACLQADADGGGAKPNTDLLAKGALQFIATLPANTAE